MQELIARCGNRCDLCPLYKDNFSLADAEAVNSLLYKYHHAGEGPRPHYARGCEGCLSDGYIAREGCEIRECVSTKRLSTCADCERLFCGLLESDMAVLEGALRRHGAEIPREDYERYFKPFMIREALIRIRGSKNAPF
jgi:hypothetical protein